MTSGPLFELDSSSARFVGGGVSEVEALFGLPLPLLPRALVEEDGRPAFYVRFDPRLRPLMQQFLGAQLRQAGLENGPGRMGSGRKEQAAYEGLLQRTLTSVLASDRRQGLGNLFWLAHSLEVALCVAELEVRVPGLKRQKQALQPLLSTLFRRVDEAARRAVEQAQPGRIEFLQGSRENGSLVDSLLDDGFAFTQLRAAELDFNLFLSGNRRHRISADVFYEILSGLTAEADRRLREGERGLLARMQKHLPALARDHVTTPAALTRIALCAPILTYLLADPWSTGPRLLSAPRLKAEAEKRRPSEVLDAFLDLAACVKRFEILGQARSHVVLIRPEETPDIEDRVRRGLRFYDFGETASVVNNAVDATVLFLDLRGFTQISEGQISARDLTQELYAVFDTFVPHIRSFGGTIDKFLGDGIMVTYGIQQPDPLGPLNAIRTAVLCQGELMRLRRQERTLFKMGVSVHYGRVYVARFIADEESVQTTVIGRNVNLAGRLSSAAKKPLDEDEGETPARPVGVRELQVTLDTAGRLLNEGIAISREALRQMEEHLPLEHQDTEAGNGTVITYYDAQIGRRLLIRYAGDAKFKGVRSSAPVYEVDWVR
jgi:class 3 adenylate cyclase